LLIPLGLVFCATIFGIPIGLACFALGHEVLKLRWARSGPEAEVGAIRASIARETPEGAVT
jgi:hypothetical protein